MKDFEKMQQLLDTKLNKKLFPSLLSTWDGEEGEILSKAIIFFHAISIRQNELFPRHNVCVPYFCQSREHFAGDEWGSLLYQAGKLPRGSNATVHV